jgi:hypothetical protein
MAGISGGTASYSSGKAGLNVSRSGESGGGELDGGVG